MWKDPIVDEIHRYREEFAAQFNFDMQAIGKVLQEREKLSGRRMVSLDQKGYSVLMHDQNS